MEAKEINTESYKDFYSLNNIGEIDEQIHTAREMINFADHQTQELQKRVSELEEALKDLVWLFENGAMSEEIQECIDETAKQALKNNLVVTNEEGE